MYSLPQAPSLFLGQPAHQFGVHAVDDLRRRAGRAPHIVKRIVPGNKVIDHERVCGIREQPVEVVAVYEIADGLIRTVWFFAPE